MKTLRILFLLAALVPGVAPVSGAEEQFAAKTPASALPPRFKQVRERIDALFEHRNQPPPRPDARMNPFRPPGPFTEQPSGDLGPSTPIPDERSDLTRLQEGVATLTVAGSSEKDGKVYISINLKTYADNDIIPVKVRGETIHLRLRGVSNRGVTFVLNEAELTLKIGPVRAPKS